MRTPMCVRVCVWTHIRVYARLCVRVCLCTALHPRAYSQSHFGRVMVQVSIEVTLH